MSKMDLRTDLQLLQAARGGDSAAFEIFYARHRELIVAYCRRRVAEPELAADLCAETFTAALIATHERASVLPDIPLSWLFTIAQRKLIDSLRRGRVQDEARRRLRLERIELADADLIAIDEIASRVDLENELRSRLPVEQADALIAHVLDDRSYGAIARELRCSEAVVRKRVSRALRALRSATGGAAA